MTDLQNAIANLKDCKTYINSFPPKEQSSRFEHLIAKSISYTLRIPFFTADTDDPTVINRVVWNGRETDWSRVEGKPDGVVYAYKYISLLEATLKQGARQWSQEFARGIAHYEAFVSETGISHEDCHLIMFVTELHDDTYNSVKTKIKEGCCYVIIPISNLITILETYSLAFTALHSDMRLLFTNIKDCCERSSDKEDYLARVNGEVSRWKAKLLEDEKNMVVGIKSYKAIKNFGEYASLSQIFDLLYSDVFVFNYFKEIGSNLSPADIEISLKQERLAYKASGLPLGEGIFAAVPLFDIKGRAKVFIKELENATSP